MTFRLVIVVCLLAAAGCAVQRPTPTEASSGAAAQAPAVSPLPADDTTAETPATSAAANEPNQTLDAPPPAAAAPKPAPPSHAVAAAPSARVVAAPDPLRTPVASQPPTETLDFASLNARLRSTKALGLLAKLSVKTEAEDLLEQFRDYYKQRGTATLPDLHRSYDSLVVKLLMLLQDGDPPLATDIDRSRAAIWDILSDQRKFIDSHLMAASP